MNLHNKFVSFSTTKPTLIICERREKQYTKRGRRGVDEAPLYLCYFVSRILLFIIFIINKQEKVRTHCGRCASACYMQTCIVVVPACGCTSLMAARRRLAAARRAARARSRPTPASPIADRLAPPPLRPRHRIVAVSPAGRGPASSPSSGRRQLRPAILGLRAPPSTV